MHCKVYDGENLVNKIHHKIRSHFVGYVMDTVLPISIFTFLDRELEDKNILHQMTASIP